MFVAVGNACKNILYATLGFIVIIYIVTIRPFCVYFICFSQSFVYLLFKYSFIEIFISTNFFVNKGIDKKMKEVRSFKTAQHIFTDQIVFVNVWSIENAAFCVTLIGLLMSVKILFLNINLKRFLYIWFFFAIERI